MYYQTEINDPTLNDIIALSDIHADIHALIISLRDCAKVIKLKKPYVLNSDQINEDTERLLNIDINTNICSEFNIYNDFNIYSDFNIKTTDNYIDDLGYEWCGGDTQVVIIGDILDGTRHHDYNDKTVNINGCNHEYAIHEYPQIEIKILLFINAINKQITTKGKIHKILGNHEIFNILFDQFESDMRYKKLIFKSALSRSDYYKGYARYDVFKPSNPGYKLLLEGGCGIILKINYNIFVHGSLRPININTLDKLNNEINNINTPIDRLINIYSKFNGSKFDYYDNLLHGRYYGHTINENYKLIENYNNEIISYDIVKRDITVFTGVIDSIELDKYRVIVGHCIQFSTKYNRTFNQIIYDDATSETLGNPLNLLLPLQYSSLENNVLFGITMQCKNKYDNNYKVYRVDVGSSRGNDDNNKNTDMIEIASRTPQVLHINNDYITIIRSKLKNTFIHQPRTSPKLLNTFDRYFKEYDKKICHNCWTNDTDITNNINIDEIDEIDKIDENIWF